MYVTCHLAFSVYNAKYLTETMLVNIYNELCNSSLIHLSTPSFHKYSPSSYYVLALDSGKSSEQVKETITELLKTTGRVRLMEEGGISQWHETRSSFFGHGYDVVRCLFHIENKQTKNH